MERAYDRAIRRARLVEIDMTSKGQTAEQRTAVVKQRAATLGFDACGIAEAGNIDPEDHFGAWLSRGYHADMCWMAAKPDVRRDVRLRVPGARSVIVVARNYYSERPAASTGTGRVARYAWGRDYHKILERPINALAAEINAMADGTECYRCVDTGPVLEKAWAARAGLGWIGKNGLVLRTDLGSWFFLGVIVTTLELSPDTPAVDRCGSCNLCIEACPTEAIVEPGVVDARKCISYHTIENRDAIPENLSRRFGPWLFGCDVCQEVCPWNRFAKPTTEPAFEPIPGNTDLDLDELRSMDDAAFQKRFAGTSIRRAKRPGLQRNAEIAQRNINPALR